MGWELLKWFFGTIAVGTALFLFIKLVVKFLKETGWLKKTKWKSKKSETDYVNEKEVMAQAEVEEPKVAEEEKPKVD